MTFSHTGLATWLLRHLGSSPKNESLIGDLVEQRRQGRSALWYWRQVMGTIAVSFFSEIRTDKLLTLRAVATGWAVVIISQFLLQPLRWIIDVSPNSVMAYYLFSRFLPETWLDYYKWIYTPLIPLTIGLFGCAIGATSGWVVARFHAARRRTSVLAYAFSMTAYFFLLIFYIVLRFGIGTVNLLSVSLFGAILPHIVSILAGGGIFRLEEARLAK